MSVYDTSPQAIAAYVANQTRCHNWAGETALHTSAFKLPFGTRSDISSASTKLKLDPDEEDDIEVGSLGVPDWERAQMHHLLGDAGYPFPAPRERERGRHVSQTTERPSTTRHHSQGRRRDHTHHHSHSRSREVIEPPFPAPPLKEKKSRSHSRHASSSSRRSRKSSNQTAIYAPPQGAPQHGYPYPVIPIPPPEPKRGFFASLFKRRRSNSLPRQPPPQFLQHPPLQTRLSRSASFHRNRGEVEAHHHSRSKSMERRAAPVAPAYPNGYYPPPATPYTNSTPSPSSEESIALHPHPHPTYHSHHHPVYVSPGPQPSPQYLYPSKHQQHKHQPPMGYFPPHTAAPMQRGVIVGPAMSGRPPIPPQWVQQQQPLQGMYARPQYSPYS